MGFHAHRHTRADFIDVEGQRVGRRGAVAIGLNNMIRILFANRQYGHVEKRRIATDIAAYVEGGLQIAARRHDHQFDIGIAQCIENAAPQTLGFQQGKSLQRLFDGAAAAVFAARQQDARMALGAVSTRHLSPLSSPKRRSVSARLLSSARIVPRRNPARICA